MHDPVFINRLAQMIQAERLAEAEKARRHRRPQHQPTQRDHFGQRASIIAGDLLIAAGRRLKAQANRSLGQTT